MTDRALSDDDAATIDAAITAAAVRPGVAVAPERARLFVVARLPDGAIADALAQLCVDDLLLACACADGAPAALAAFDAEHAAVIDRAAASVGATGAERADVVQIVRARLLVADGERPPRIATYSGRGRLSAWVRVVATREAARLVRRERRDEPADDAELADLITADAGPELAYLAATYRAALGAAFRDAILALDDRDRLLLRQHGLDGLSIDRLAAFYRVHRATVARWLEAARAAVLRGTRAALARRLQLRADELDSVLRLVQSRLDLTLPTALRHAGD